MQTFNTMASKMTKVATFLLYTGNITGNIFCGNILSAKFFTFSKCLSFWNEQVLLFYSEIHVENLKIEFQVYF